MNRRPGFDWPLIFRLAKILRRNHIEVIHSHNWNTFFYSVLAARLAFIPVILHGEHGRETAHYERSWKRLWMRKFLASFCHHLTAVSLDIAQTLQEVWGVPRFKISYLPNGIALDKFKPAANRSNAKRALGIDPNAPTISTIIGWIRPVKDLPNLIKAFHIVRHRFPDAQLLVVGEGPSRREAETMAKEMEMSGAAHFLGKQHDITNIMAATDVYVNSSLYEGMSNTILEALACGIPVVATAVGGTSLILRDGENGMLVPPKSPERMSEAISEFLSDEKKRNLLVQAGRAYIEQNHAFEKTIKKYEALYRHLYYDKKQTTRAFYPKQFVKAAYGNACHAFGLTRIYSKARRSSINIVNYHRVLFAHEIPHYLFTPMAMSLSVFEKQMDFFYRRCHVLSMEECVHILQNNLAIPDRAIVLTFDDGYGELYTNVKPILESYKIPCTIFLPTALIDNDQPIWFDVVSLRLKTANTKVLRNLEQLSNGLASTLLKLGAATIDQRNTLTRKAVQQIIQLPYESRQAVIARINEWDLVSNGAPEISLLTWEMVQEMKKTGLFTFGSHTLTHPPLDLLPENVLEKEITESKQKLEEKLHQKVDLFSYPWGRYNDLVVEKVKQAGYRCAFALTHAPNYTGQDLFTIRRLDAAYLTLDHFFHVGTMATELAGMNHIWRSLKHKLTGVPAGGTN
jgi:glycosyltransferase involved in cell wall biosynthesis/peptidoglycan/xylan/chitin deacetylase (PgdA/CDA1 family)